MRATTETDQRYEDTIRQYEGLIGSKFPIERHLKPGTEDFCPSSEGKITGISGGGVAYLGCLSCTYTSYPQASQLS